MRENIIFVGLMGTGKTTIGRALSNYFHWPQVDCDEWIAELEQQSIQNIFQKWGEAKFREMETTALETILQRSKQIVTTGGGATIRPKNRKIMLENGLVVALHADFATIVKRVRGDEQRPLLQGNVEDRVRAIIEARMGLYDFAHIHIDTVGKSVDEIASEIYTRMKDMYCMEDFWGK